MLIYPAIDLINGKAVRLTKGDYSTTEVFYDNPIDALRSFKKDGATQLHLVDLDGAKDGTTANFEVIKALVKEGDTFIEVGGGIRTTEHIRKYLDIGVNRVILGTIAVTDFEFVKKSVKEFGAAIAIGVDAKNAKVAVNGWKTITNVSSFDFCEKCRDAGVATIIYTDIATDGNMRGTNLEAFSRLSKLSGLQLIASGGVTYYEELEALSAMGVYGVILGKALYKGLIDLRSAVKLCEVRK